MERKKKVLVVGDWLIDEHWLTGIHRSSFSSRIGSAHYRALHNFDSVVTNFCGAGTPASLLYQKINNRERLFDIIGMGLWHNEDSEILKSMFSLEHKSLSPYKLTHTATKPELPGIELINLSEALPASDIKQKISTTRIVRIYHSWSSDSNKILPIRLGTRSKRSRYAI
jgi:hypothetical protein